jgi:hypothetical protein
MLVVISLTARTLHSPAEFDNGRSRETKRRGDREKGRRGEGEILVFIATFPLLLVSSSPCLPLFCLLMSSSVDSQG